jgi:surface antigen
MGNWWRGARQVATVALGLALAAMTAVPAAAQPTHAAVTAHALPVSARQEAGSRQTTADAPGAATEQGAYARAGQGSLRTRPGPAIRQRHCDQTVRRDRTFRICLTTIRVAPDALTPHQRALIRRGLAAKRPGTAISPMVAPITAPAQCAFTAVGPAATGVNYPDRFTSCAASDNLVEAMEVNDAGETTVIGEFDWVALEWTQYTGASDDSGWSHGLALTPYNAWGTLAAGLTMSVQSECEFQPGVCAVADVVYPDAQPVLIPPTGTFTNLWGEVDDGPASAAAGLADTLDDNLGIRYTVPPTATGPGTTIDSQRNGLAGRCDSMVGAIGCVDERFTPTLVYSSVLNPAVGPVAQHVYDSQHGGLVTAWGVPPTVLPNGAPLSLETSQANIDANRNVACPPNVPRPAGYQCDEFPMATTQQGAAANPDYSAVMVPAAANGSQGALTGAFYAANRMIQADQFWVLAIPPAGGGIGGGGGPVTGGWVIGHAAHVGNDYPYATLGQFDHQSEGTDAWNEYYGQCDSFAAWKVYENLAGSAAQHPSIIPAPGWQPSNASISPVNQYAWGNADAWAAQFGAHYVVDTIPSPGAIAYWPNATTDPQDGNPPDPSGGIGEFGHVAYVDDVYPDGSITIEQYNMRENGEYSVAHLANGQGYTDNSFGLGSFSVPWPKYFIHVADNLSPGGTQPTEPAVGVVSAGYSSLPLVIGPGSPSGEFTTGSVWYSQPGHGEIGTEQYTHTNGASADSTATWKPAGLADSTCYRVDAFVPDNYSDNPLAIYTVTDGLGTATSAVDENDTTDDWAELGVFETTSAGALTVKVDDRGNTGLYVAADAMRFWKQASCSAYGNASPVLAPGTLSSGGWSSDSGHGFFGSMHYAVTSGSATTVGQTAGWLPTHLVAGECYELSAYVPDNYSDNYAARYQVIDSFYGTLWPQVNENAFTNQFAALGDFRATSSGQLSVVLTNIGPGGQYVGADAVAFVLDPSASGCAFGSAYDPPDIIGPGSGPASFTTGNAWFSGVGHGYASHDLWTHTNGSTADSTATWTATLSPHACYNVSAYIPANYYANNTDATYDITIWNGANGAGGPFTANQAAIGNAWASLGQITTQSGLVTVTLSDTGPTGTYTAADAMRFSPC